jgi:hypothetical protein
LSAGRYVVTLETVKAESRRRAGFSSLISRAPSPNRGRQEHINAQTIPFKTDVVLTELKDVGRLNFLTISATAVGEVATLAPLCGVVLMTVGA